MQWQFQTTDLGLRYFLGVEVARSRIGLNQSQRKYVLDLLDKTRLLGAHLIDVLMNPNKKHLKDEGELFEDPNRCQRLVGKLNDLILTIVRPDISYADVVLSQFLEAPRIPHWDVVIRIVQYLKEAFGLGIVAFHFKAAIACRGPQHSIYLPEWVIEEYKRSRNMTKDPWS